MWNVQWEALLSFEAVHSLENFCFKKYDSYTKVNFSLRLHEISVTVNKLHVIIHLNLFLQVNTVNH